MPRKFQTLNKQLVIRIFALSCTLLITSAYAIQVVVKTNSNDVYALGFLANGERYGTLGTSYVNNNAPVGNYEFGVRAGRDVPCLNKGKKSVTLKKNTTVLLKYDGRTCKVLFLTKQ